MSETVVNSPEFEGIKNQAGLNSFILSVEFMSVWERLNNPSFNTTEFSSIRKLEDQETK